MALLLGLVSLETNKKKEFYFTIIQRSRKKTGGPVDKEEKQEKMVYQDLPDEWEELLVS